MMICDDTRKLLLELGPAAELGDASRDHLRDCAACRELALRIERLDTSWRALPVPETAAESKRSFLRRLGPQPAGARFWRSRSMIRWAVAASFFLVVLVGAWLVLPTQEATAAQVLDELVEWNLALLVAPDDVRTDLAKQHWVLESELRRADLSDEDRAFGHVLLARGARLTREADPMEVADHFDALAEVAHQRLDKAMKQGQTREAARWAKRFGSLDERGVKVSLDRGKKKALNASQVERWEQIAKRGNHRQQAVRKMVDEAPEASRHELRRTLSLGKKANRPPKG